MIKINFKPQMIKIKSKMIKIKSEGTISVVLCPMCYQVLWSYEHKFKVKLLSYCLSWSELDYGYQLNTIMRCTETYD